MKKTLFKLLLFLLLVYGGKIHAQNVYMSENGNFTNAEGGIFIDFNNDGKMDYLDSPNYAGGVLNLYRNTGTGMVLEQTLNTQEYVNYFYHSRHGEDKEAYYADFNEDGVKDLLLYASNHAYCGNNVIRIYWGSATYPYFANANYLTLSANSPYCVGAVAVDFNNDGRRDVHVRSASGVNTMLRNDGGGVFTSVPTFNTGRDISQFFYDIDGDGIQDLVYGKNGWADGQFGFRYNKGLGNGDFNSTTQIYYDAQGVREWDVMPINGNPLTDNKMDVALIALNDGTNANTLYLGQYNNGTDNFTFTTQSIGTNFPDQRLIASLDYNNDGFMDILNSYKTASSPSRWTTRILQNNGNGVFTVGATIFENQPYYPTQIAKGNNGQVLLSTRLLNVAENAVTSVTVWELQPPTIPSSSIVVAPLSLNFGDVLVGATHTQTFSITNTTSNPINIVNVAYPSNFSGDFSTGVISANSTQTVTVTFTPNAAQTSNANIQINAYGVVSSYSINVIGNGIVCAAPTFSLPASACINASTIPLVGSPAGGVFTINGATATSLEPSVLGAGNHTVVYTSPLCANPETKVITINPLPTLSFIGLNSTYCVNGDNVNLQASPAGGLFMVDGLNATYIHPATLGVGTHPIVYGYTDANGCSNTITQNITITDLPTVSFVNNASLLVEDDFSTPASQNNWTMVETQNGGGTFSVASGNLQLYTAGGSNGYMGQPDGFTIKATYPNMPTDYTNKEISLNLEQVSITQYGANKGNVGSRFIIGNGGSGAYFSGTPLQNGIMIMQYGFYRGYAPDPPYSYNVWSGNTVEIWQGVSGNWSKITTLNYPIFEYQNLDFKVVHQGGSWKVLHKKSIETSYSTVIIPDFNLTANLTCFFYHGSGDGGYTYQNAQAITHINAFQIKDLSVASTLPTSVCALSAPFDLLASPSGGVFAVNGTSATQFNPTMLGTGTHMVSYTYTNATCTNTITQNVTINPLPTLSFVGLNNTYPVDMGTVNLQASPAGGTFMVDGANATDFTPTTLGIGTHAVVYTYTNANGCSNTITQNIEITPVVPITEVLYNSPAPDYVLGISNAIIHNNEITVAVGTNPSTKPGYPDGTVWSTKVKLVNENGLVPNGEIYNGYVHTFDFPIRNHPTSTKIGFAYQTPVVGYGFNLPYAVWNGTSVESSENVFENSNSGWCPRFQYNNAGMPRITSFAHGGYFLLYHNKDAGSWVNNAITNYGTHYTPIASVMHNNNYYFVARQNTGGSNIVLFKEEAGWVPELIATSSNHVSDLKIHGANIYALYTDGVQLKLAQRPLSGGSWTIETVATQDSTTHRSSLFFANDNTPYVAFMKGIVTNITLKVYKKTAGVWSEVFSKSDLQFHSEHWYHGQSPTMMQKNSNIYVVYADNYKVYLTNLNAQSITQQYVSLTGFDTNDGLTTISAKRTITSALASVMEGGNINVMAGTYNETVNVTKNITLGTSGVVSIQNLTMNGVGKTLVLSSPLRVSQVVALQAGTIASSGNLILNSDVAGTALVDDFTSGYTGNITGNVQVKRYVANGNAGYRYFGSPVTGATASQFGATTFAYNESILLRDMNAGWQVMAGSATITPFSAYNVWQNTPNNQTYTLTGAINTGSYNMAITRQTPIINTTTGAVTNNSAGFNAIGNPYPSPISWTGLLSLNSGVTTGTAWLFKTTELYKGQWASLNSSGIGTNGATNMIASMQGFLVRKATAGSGNFTINNSIRSNVFANNGNYLRAVEKPLVRLQITNGEVADETVMYVEQGATDKFDVNFDTEKLVGEADKPYIAFTTANQDVSILAMERLPRNVGTPLIIRGNGIFDLKITEKLSIDEKVFLYDRKTNELHDLEAKYTFQITGTENNRFVLYIGKPTQEQLAEGGENIRIWTNEKTLFVRFATLDLAKESQADILTIQGQPIITNLSFSEADTQKILSLPIGVYIIRVKNQQGITSKKMLVR